MTKNCMTQLPIAPSMQNPPLLCKGVTSCSRDESFSVARRTPVKAGPKLNSVVHVGKESHGPVKKPLSMTRAKTWNFDVENQFRLQMTGWQSEAEYTAVYGPPNRWKTTGFYSKLQVKVGGRYSYWREYRECPDSHVPRIKMYSYEPKN